MHATRPTHLILLHLIAIILLAEGTNYEVSHCVFFLNFMKKITSYNRRVLCSLQSSKNFHSKVSDDVNVIHVR
jgi:hypothetical protein